MANIIDIIINAQDQASSVVEGVSDSFGNLGASAQKVGGVAIGALAAMGAALAVVGNEGFKYNAMLESSEARWSTLTGSIEGANKQMDFISQYAKSSPFDYQGIDETATSLTGMGMELKDVNKWIPTLGDMASVMGGGTETIKGVGTALGQMNAKGKVSAEEMMQLAERGVNGWGMLADGMGLSVAEVQKLSSEGKILASDALPLIQAGMAEAFGGGTATYMASAKGQFEQLKEGASQFAGVLTEGAFNAFGTTILPALNSGLTGLQSIFAGGLVSGFQNLASGSLAGQAALAGMAGVLVTLLIPALISTISAVAPFVVAFLPFIAIGAAVAGIALLIMANWSTVKPFFMGIFNAISPMFEAFKASALNSFSTLMAGVAPLWSAFKALLVSLQPVLAIVGAVLGVLLTVAMGVFNGIVAAILPVITAFLSLVGFVTDVVMTIVNLLTGNWSGALASWNSATQHAVTFFQSIWNAVKSFVTAFINTVVAIFSSFGVNLVGIFQSMWSSITSAVSSGIASIVAFFTGLKATGTAIIKALGSAITSGFTSAMSSAVSAVSKGASNVIKFFTNLKSQATASVKTLGSAITSGFTSAMSSARSAVSAGVSAILGFFKNLGSSVISTIKNIASNMVSSFTSMMSRARSAVSSGVQGIVSAIKGFASTFLSAGKGLLDAFTNGIKSGISKAKNAVSSGMAAIRDFLPFSPAKKGPLSDLDKSGESFFPTWYEGALTQVRGMERAISGAMSGLNGAMEDEHSGVQLSSFTGGKTKNTIQVVIGGSVDVKGDTHRDTVDFVSKQIETQVNESSIFGDLRQASRGL